MAASASPPRSPGRPRSAEADQAILGATVRLLAEQGYDAMSIEGVAADAGVGKTTIYRRYANKRDLVVAAISSVASTPSELPDTGDTRADLITLIREMFALLRSTGVGLSMLGTLLVKERDEPMLLELFRERVILPRIAVAGALLHRGVQRGELRPDIEPEVILPIVVGSTVARHLAGLPEDDAWLESMVDAVWRGIAAR